MKLTKHIFAFALMLLCMSSVRAEDHFAFDSYFADVEERDSLVRAISESHRIIWHEVDGIGVVSDTGTTSVPDFNGDEWDVTFRRLKNRRALVGDSCSINRLVNVVSVGAWDKDKGNLLDYDLDNFAQFNRVIGAGVTVDPVVAIRDGSAYYAKGTEAGFCIVAGSGDAVLSLNIVKAYSIGFYRDGQLMGYKALQEGEKGEGIGLSLIQIPGSDDVAVVMSAVSDWVFDEIQIDRSGGVQAGVGDLLKVKYAFVGRAREFYIGDSANDHVDNGIDAIREYYERPDLTRPELSGYNPVLLGIPFPLVSSEREKMRDGDDSTGAAITPILAAGYQGGAKFTIDDPSNSAEVFPAGTEVGWNYNYGSGLTLDAGAWIRLILFDRNGNKVQEETIEAQVLNLNVAKGGSGKSALVASVPFSGCEIRFHTAVSVNLGAIVVYNAFVTLRPDVGHHCPINPTISQELCTEQTTYQLMSNPKVSVTWTLESAPAETDVTVSPSGFVQGLDPNKGPYVFRATASDGCFDFTQISFVEEGFDKLVCDRPAIDEFGYELSNRVYDSSGSLISAENWVDEYPKENIVDSDLDNYAQFQKGLKLANNIMLVGVKTKDGTDIYNGRTDTEEVQYDEDHNPLPFKYPDGIRIGFVVEENTTTVDVGLLQFFLIRCYKNGVKVYEHVVEQSQVITAGVIGSDEMLKQRFSIKVPSRNSDGDLIAFDEYQLWTAGVLELDLAGTLNIYYPYYEEVSARCDNPLECSGTLLGTSTHTTLNADETKYGGTIDVANVTNNIMNLIDDDPNSYMEVVNSVSVGSGRTIAVKLGRTMDYRQKFGIITDNKTYTANVKVGGWLTLEMFYNGEPTGDKYTDWNVVGAKVIGFGDNSALLVDPTKPYDEVRITIAGVVGALSEQKFYGIFVQSDIANDGIPDCRDPKSCETNLDHIEVETGCVGDFVNVKVHGTITTWYTVTFSEPFKDDEGNVTTVHQSAPTDEYGYHTFGYQAATPGHYQMVFREGKDETGRIIKAQDYYVTPNVTTWRTDASSNIWQKWDNWSNGFPSCCTDVIIPTDASVYPTIKDERCCRDIHFEPETRVSRIYNLKYRKAFVEIKFLPNRYNLFAAPLREFYTGDLFIPEAMKGVHYYVPDGKTEDTYFIDLTDATSPQNRINPSLYQRQWYTKAVKAQKLSGIVTFDDYDPDYKLEETVMSTTTWSRNFNHVATDYGFGRAFSIWVDNGNLPADLEFRFRFPKLHSNYKYYFDFDNSDTGKNNDVTRTTYFEEKCNPDDEEEVTETVRLSNRFAYEGQGSGTVRKQTDYKGGQRISWNIPSSLTLTAAEPTNIFLFGNPFMSDIKLGLFFKENKDDVTAVRFYDGNTVKTVTYDKDANTMSGETDLNVITPMQGVFVVANSSATALTLNLNEDMLYEPMADDMAPEPSPLPALKITLRDANWEASAQMTDNVKLDALFDDEVAPTLAVWTLDKDGNACELQPEADVLPLGIKTGGDAVLSFKAINGFDRSEYLLVDMATGSAQELDEPLAIQGEGTSIGRYALARRNLVKKLPMAAESAVVVTAEGGQLKVVATGAEIAHLAICDTAGRILSSAEGRGSEMTASVDRGVCIVIIELTDGSRHNFKLLV